MLGTARGSHVRLLQGYCPMCFKGRVGVSTSICLARGDPCIDEELQVLFAGNGLPMLDLETPGERCENTKMCKVMCVVCAESVADGDDKDEFLQLVEALDRFEEVDSELDGELGTGPLQFLAVRLQEDARLNRLKTLRKFGLTWLDRLGKPVHIECAKETPCGCVVSKGAVRCITHDRRLLVNKKPATMEVKHKVDEPKGVFFKNVVAPSDGGVRRPIVMKRATWLDPPTKLASVSGLPAPQQEGGGVYKKKSRPQIIAVKSTRPTAALKLEEAAKSTAYKINEWTSGGGGVPETAVKKTTPMGGQKYDMDKHNRDFDMWAHGRFVRNGEWFYRRPDGVVIPANEGVSYFDEYGMLVPC